MRHAACEVIRGTCRKTITELSARLTSCNQQMVARAVVQVLPTYSRRSRAHCRFCWLPVGQQEPSLQCVSDGIQLMLLLQRLLAGSPSCNTPLGLASTTAKRQLTNVERTQLSSCSLRTALLWNWISSPQLHRAKLGHKGRPGRRPGAARCLLLTQLLVLAWCSWFSLASARSLPGMHKGWSLTSLVPT